MGTISDKLMRIINTKEDIRQALISKGYDVPTSIPFKEYAKMILDLPCNADSFPDIEGIVARYSASGLTNEQMAANPVWVDKTGNGHDLQLKNFSWKGMSGIGGYVVDIDEWGTNSTAAYFERNSIKITATFKENASLGLLYHNIKLRQSCVLKVTGIPEGCDAFLDDRLGNRFYMSEDGVYEIIPSNFLAEALYLSIEKYPERWYGSKLTVEQLPLYPGALVFDGVDDYGTCNNFPILTKEKGYTVVALRQWITYNPNVISAIATNASDRSFNGAFTFENYNKGAEQTISYGATQISLQYSKSPFSWQTTSKYNGFNIANGNKDATNSLVLGRSYPQRNEFANFAIWELVFLDHDATEEELTKIKDYFIKTYPWLFPDQAWTVTGKTNEDEDRATIANITGNGNDLVLSNFGFAEGSGYGLYKLNFNNWFANSGSGNVNIVNVVNPHKIVLEQSQEAVGAFFLGKNVSYSGELKISVSNKPSDIELSFGSTALGKVILNEGINIVKINPVNTSIGFFTNKAFEAQNIIIEQIPEYKGYLLTDGVDDKAVSKQFKFGENFTVILDFKFPVKKISYCGFDLSSKVRIQNLQGSGVYVVLKGNKTLIPSNVVRAVTSEGKVYDENWNEYNIVPGNISSNYTMVNLGFDGSNQFAESATKLAGIYSSALSKDDCVKAYNYLQTLKSK